MLQTACSCWSAVKANVSVAAHIALVSCHVDKGIPEQLRSLRFCKVHAGVSLLSATLTSHALDCLPMLVCCLQCYDLKAYAPVVLCAMHVLNAMCPCHSVFVSACCPNNLLARHLLSPFFPHSICPISCNQCHFLFDPLHWSRLVLAV